MSRLLAELLGASEHTFKLMVENLEKASGMHSTDVRLTAEVIEKIHKKCKELGLDSKDTTPKELYHALQGLMRLHDDFLAKRLGGDDAADTADVVPRVTEKVSELTAEYTIWGLKTSVMKRLLKTLPPKRVMKYLGYRSIDSMLKREAMSEIYAGIILLENERWHENLYKKYGQLGQVDFEVRPLMVQQLNGHKWQKAAEEYLNSHREHVLHCTEIGAVYVLPLPVKRLPGIALTTFVLLLHHINELRVHNSYLKLHQVSAHFGDCLAKLVSEQIPNLATIAGQPVGWHHIHRHFGSVDSSKHPEIFDPHIGEEDLSWHTVEESLYRLEPALHFWHDMNYVGKATGAHPVSFNLMDVAINYVNKLPFEQRSSQYLRKSLQQELIGRYLRFQALEQQVVKQLRDRLAQPVFAKVEA